MRVHLLLSFLALAVISATTFKTHASVDVQNNVDIDLQDPSKQEVAAEEPDLTQDFAISAGSAIKFKADQVIFEQAEFRGRYNKSIVLEKDDHISILPATEESAKLGLIRVGMGVNDMSKEPSLLLIPEQLLPKDRLIPLTAEQAEFDGNNTQVADDDESPIEALMKGVDLAQGADAGFENYEEARYGRWSFRHSRGHHGKRRGGMTYCLRNVRHMLCARGICCSNSFGGVAAYAMPNIRKQCGHRMSSAGIGSHGALKVGSVCCVSGGYHRCGGGKCGDCVMKVGSNAWTNGYGVRASPLRAGVYRSGSCASLR